MKPVDWKGSDGKARGEVVSFLKARGGEISHADGLAVVEMQSSLGRSRSLSNLLRTMEHDHMIEREVRGRRTYRIKLLDDWGLGTNDGVGTVIPLRPASHDGQAPDTQGVDYGLLAESLLAIVMRKVSEPATAKPDKTLVDRLRKSEAAGARLEVAAAEAAAERDTLRKRVTELEEQGRLYERNMSLLRAEMDKPKHRRDGGSPLAERLSAGERGMLAELMKTLPETPQSKPRRTR